MRCSTDLAHLRTRHVRGQVVLKHSHMYIYEDEASYLQNDPELDMYWLKFCQVKEIHNQSDTLFKLLILDLRLDKMVVLAFDSGLTREVLLFFMLSIVAKIIKYDI